MVARRLFEPTERLGWMSQADVDAGRKEGLSSDERKELVKLRRENRTLAMENEILKRAAAFFAREAVAS